MEPGLGTKEERMTDVQDEAPDSETLRLRSIVRELSGVVHGLGHDLREPIRMVSCYADLIRLRTSIESDPNAMEYLHVISTAARRMESLVVSILDYARLFGNETPPHNRVDMNAVLQTALANLQMQIDESHATIAHDELPDVTGDASQLTQLMQNLVGNAMKYRGPQPPQILLRAEATDGMWRFAVQDNGIGIEPQHFRRLFAPFNRLHGHEVPGVGLGLAICRSIVERHGGRIWVESTYGKGSTFQFTLARYEGNA